uniref:VeG52P n=1 Tax=Conus vexillum TaxID=89431 RepID=Q3YEF5_CONVX|nr:VeG52P [Conus vexillum]
MKKLTILLLIAAVLMLTQALIQEKRPEDEIKFLSKRKSGAQRWWDGECRLWSNGCRKHKECCSNHCKGIYCDIW